MPQARRGEAGQTARPVRGSAAGRRLLAGVAASALVTAGFTATATGAGAQTTPGVSSTQITTGAISTLSGTLASDFASLVPGIRAYFDMVNASGGINGRKLSLTYSLDDGGNPSQFNQLAHTLVDQDHVFAVAGVATAFFSPNYFVATKTPTYGYNVVGNWSPEPNLFAAGGSALYYPAEVPYVAYLAKKVKATSVAVVAYGIAASSDSCQASINGLKKDGIKVGYQDLNVAYPGSGISSDVQRMQQAGTDLVLSCLDVTGNVAMARAIQQYGLKTHQLWLDGNDQSTLNQYPSLMKGVYFTTSHVPFTAPTKYYPGLKTYLTAMEKYSPKYVHDEVAIQGWQGAALLAQGVKAAGSNLTQANLITQTNKITDFTAGGLTTPVDWATTGHAGHSNINCAAYIQVQGKKFVSVFASGHQVFTCFNLNDKNPVPVPAPAGTPGT